MSDGALASLVIAASHIHIDLRLPGPHVDYVGVLVGAALTWAGLPGPGEAALVAAAITAAHHHLDLASLIAVAWLGATAGGVAGWLVGLKAGRRVATAPGPLRRHRLAVVARGDRFFDRYGAVAVLLTPSWIAGIHRMPWTRYLLINGLSALAWALGIGLGAYAVGPPIVEVVNDIGSAAWVILALLIVTATVGVLLRKRQRRAQDQDS